MRMKFAGVSLVALGVAMGGPALAAQHMQPGAAAQPTTPQVTGERQPGMTQRIGVDQLMDKLGEIGIEDREAFGGAVLRAETEQGHPFILLVGPQDFEAGETIEFVAEDYEELREQLTEAGMDQVRQDHEWTIIQGYLNGHYVLAAAGEPQMDRQPAVDVIAAEEVDGEALRDRLGEIGVEDRESLEGKLIRARTEEGELIYLLVGPEGFAGGEEIEFDADELRERFEEAGLTDVQVIEEDAYLMRGNINDRAVLAMVGPGLTTGVEPTVEPRGPAATGAVPSPAPAPSPETAPAPGAAPGSY